jgi:ubiquitin-like protein Pup
MAQQQLKKQATPKETVEEQPPTGFDTGEIDKLKSEMDALLDEIDGVLEDNAQEFVDSYIQKGGE